MDLDNTQRRFAIMGENAFLIANKLMKNQRLCRLLKYQTRAPFSDSWTDPITKEVRAQPEVQGEDLINKQILIVPKVFDDSVEKMSYVISVFDDFTGKSFYLGSSDSQKESVYAFKNIIFFCFINYDWSSFFFNNFFFKTKCISI